MIVHIIHMRKREKDNRKNLDSNRRTTFGDVGKQNLSERAEPTIIPCSIQLLLLLLFFHFVIAYTFVYRRNTTYHVET